MFVIQYNKRDIEKKTIGDNFILIFYFININCILINYTNNYSKKKIYVC